MKKNQVNEDTELSPLQEKAVYLLASGKSITETANELKTDRATLYNWQKQLEFEAFYNKVRYELQLQTKNELLNLYSTAMITIKNCLQSENENIKLKTAIYIVEHIKDYDTGFITKEQLESQKRFSGSW